MKKKLLDTFVRISKGTRAKMNAHCKRNNLQQGRFADSAILNEIETDDSNREFIARKAARNGDKGTKEKTTK